MRIVPPDVPGAENRFEAVVMALGLRIDAAILPRSKREWNAWLVVNGLTLLCRGHAPSEVCTAHCYVATHVAMEQYNSHEFCVAVDRFKRQDLPCAVWALGWPSRSARGSRRASAAQYHTRATMKLPPGLHVCQECSLKAGGARCGRGVQRPDTEHALTGLPCATVRGAQGETALKTHDIARRRQDGWQYRVQQPRVAVEGFPSDIGTEFREELRGQMERFTARGIIEG